MTRLGRTGALILLAMVFAGLLAWCGLALRFSPLLAERLRLGASLLWLCASLVALAGFFRARWRWRAVAVMLFGLAVVGGAWFRLEPSNERDWQPELALLPWATMRGDMITIHNVRDSEYRSETDFDVRYQERSFDLGKLESVDLVSVYWMGPAIAHTMLSFGFGGGDFITISIEARKERGEAYSAIGGFFRRYELIYVVAEERDAIRLRTNYRHDPPEDVYIYRLRSDPEGRRRLLLEYMRTINQLRKHPAWYNSAARNCTGNIWLHAAVNPGRVPFSWKILLSGFVPEYLAEMDRLEPGVPLATLRAAGHVNARAQAADTAADFSRRIRAGVPGYTALGAVGAGTER